MQGFVYVTFRKKQSHPSCMLIASPLHVGLVLGVVACLRNCDFSVGVVVGLLFHCLWTTHLKGCTIIAHRGCWAEAATPFHLGV